jgi:hypothetical protein
MAPSTMASQSSASMTKRSTPVQLFVIHSSFVLRHLFFISVYSCPFVVKIEK